MLIVFSDIEANLKSAESKILAAIKENIYTQQFRANDLAYLRTKVSELKTSIHCIVLFSTNLII